MGNALEAAKFSVLQGNTGVGDKKTTLKAIDDGMASVKAWKENIDTERLKLKTDTATSYRDAEKDAQKKIDELAPSNKTERDIIVNGLSDYKDRLYNNMNMVKSGMIKPKDNVIFQANGKQSFEIMTSTIKNIAAENELTLKRARGGLWPDEEGGLDVQHDPTAKGYEAALQRIQSTLTNPEFVKVNFGEDGMGTVNFYETQVNEETKIRELKRDKDGNPVILPGKSGISLLAFQQGRNQRADYFNLDKHVKAFTDPTSNLGKAWQTMVKDPNGKIYGSIQDWQGDNPEVKALLDSAIDLATITTEQNTSILIDNGPLKERSELLTPSEWLSAKKQGKINLDEKIKYTYTDASGEELPGEKFKYIQLVVGSNNQIVSKWREGDLDASRRLVGTVLYASLKKTLKIGTKRSEFKKTEWDPLRQNKVNRDNQTTEAIGRVDFAVRMAQGDPSALEELTASGRYTLKDEFNEILSNSKVQKVDPKNPLREGQIYQVLTEDGVEPRIVYHTDEKGDTLSLEERTRQTIALIGTNPTQTKDLFNTYLKEGNNFDDDYDKSAFKASVVGTAPTAKLSLETVVEGTGTKTVTMDARINEVIKAADDAVPFFGVSEDKLDQGIESVINAALLKSGQKLEGLNVSHSGNNITIKAKNSNGKLISVTGEQSSTTTKPMRIEVKAIMNEFFQNLDSDKDYNNTGKSVATTGATSVNYSNK